MQASGSLFLLGEHSGFAARNQSVIDVIAAAGGGDVPLPAGSIGTQYVTATFNGANLIVDDLNTGFFVPAAGTVTSPGTGIFFTTSEANGGGSGSGRSEEHTSELQSLMRNSYAVFCLQKKKQQKNT